MPFLVFKSTGPFLRNECGLFEWADLAIYDLGSTEDPSVGKSPRKIVLV